MNIVATGVTDAVKGTLTINLDFTPATEVEHELLAVLLQDSQTFVVVHDHVGDVLKSHLVVTDLAAWPAAVHNLANRKRIVDGRPTIEQENELRAASEQPPVAESEVVPPAPQHEGALSTQSFVNNNPTLDQQLAQQPEPEPPQAT